MNAPADRATIERELEILRTRHALMQKWARITEWFFVIAGGVTATVAIVAFVMGDPATGGVSLLACLCTAFVILWFRGGSWIDGISYWPAWGMRRTQSEAQAIETMIAERERLLEELDRQT
jgi:hypothetical protein